MMTKVEDWKSDEWGVPIHMAHLGGISLYTFSIRSFFYAQRMGADISREDLEAVLHVWKYVGYLMGVNDEMLFSTLEDAEEMFNLGHECEPTAEGTFAPEVAHAAVGALPLLSGFEGREAKKFEKFVYKLSRSLIGDKVADQLGYPQGSTLGTIPLFRLQLRFRKLFRNNRSVFTDLYERLFQVMHYDDEGTSYRLPTHVRDSKSEPW